MRMIQKYKQYIKEDLDYEEEDDDDEDFVSDKVFRNFLIGHEALDDYIQSCYGYAKTLNDTEWTPKHIAKLFKNKEYGRYISAAFAWGENTDYWENLDNKWQNLIGEEPLKYWESVDYEEEPDDDDEDDSSSFITNDKFKQFLIDNNCLELYVRNCHMADDDDTIRFQGHNMIKEFTYTDDDKYIIWAFDWKKVPESEDFGAFWNKMYGQWNLYKFLK